jgi:hypothetical protein
LPWKPGWICRLAVSPLDGDTAREVACAAVDVQGAEHAGIGINPVISHALLQAEFGRGFRAERTEASAGGGKAGAGRRASLAGQLAEPNSVEVAGIPDLVVKAFLATIVLFADRAAE